MLYIGTPLLYEKVIVRNASVTRGVAEMFSLIPRYY